MWRGKGKSSRQLSPGQDQRSSLLEGRLEKLKGKGVYGCFPVLEMEMVMELRL